MESQPPTIPPKSTNIEIGQPQLPSDEDSQLRSWRASRPDPGTSWIPPVLDQFLKEDLVRFLTTSGLLLSTTHAPETAHPILSESYHKLHIALSENAQLATKLLDLELQLTSERSSTQAQLLATHALERQWRQKQTDLDSVLRPFSPTLLYQRLCHSIQEHQLVCHALEESFLDSANDESLASEREIVEWARRYREAKAVLYSRQERKERWDEGRVGGWR